MCADATECLVSLECTSPDYCGLISNLVHDQYMPVSGVTLDESRRIVAIPFMVSSWKSGQPNRLACMRVHFADALDVSDPANIGVYQLMDVGFDEQGTAVLIHAEPGLTIRVRVSRLLVDLVVFPQAGPEIPEVKLLGFLKGAGSPRFDDVTWPD